MPSAIEKYLKGEFEKELNADTLYMLDIEQEALINNIHKYFTSTCKQMTTSYSYGSFSYSEYDIDREYDIKYIDQHDLFGWRTSSPFKVSNRLSNCIDDRCDYK